MARNNFAPAFAKLLPHEGGYVNHPKDPGGATNMGITHITLAAWRGVDYVTPAQVRALKVDEAKSIYKAQYWDAARLDEIPAGLDYAVFDFGVNSGVGRSVRYLQMELKARGLYDGAIDGIIGAKSLNAIRQVNDLQGLINAFMDRRLAFLKRLKGWSTFGNGWNRRVREVRASAVEMTSIRQIAPTPPVRPDFVSDCRTPHDVAGACDIKKTATTEGQAATGVGVGAAGAALSEAAGQLAPLADFSEVIKWVFVGLLVASVAVTLFTSLRRVNQSTPEVA